MVKFNWHLPKQEILKLIEKGELISKNFSEKHLEPASYDIRLGEEWITSTDKKKINKKNNLAILKLY